MKQIAPIPDGQINIHVDPQNTYIVDTEAFYMYCNHCGLVKAIHPFSMSNARQLFHDSANICMCHHETRKELDADQEVITHFLKDFDHAVGQCSTVEEAQQLVWSLASRQEMAEMKEIQ